MDLHDVGTIASAAVGVAAFTLGLLAYLRGGKAERRAAEAHGWARAAFKRDHSKSSSTDQQRLVQERAEQMAQTIIEWAEEHVGAAGYRSWDLEFEDEVGKEAARSLIGDPRFKEVRMLPKAVRISIEPRWW